MVSDFSPSWNLTNWLLDNNDLPMDDLPMDNYANKVIKSFKTYDTPLVLKSITFEPARGLSRQTKQNLFLTL